MTLSFVLLTGSFVAVMMLAAIWDLRLARIPNWLTVPALLIAPVLRGFLESGPAAMDAVVGGVLGLILGMVLFGLGVVGGGDSKLLAVVGAFLGPAGFGTALLAAGVAGGLLGLIVAARAGRLQPVVIRTWELGLWLVTLGRKGTARSLNSPDALPLPYGVAIAAGALLTWFLPLGLRP